MIINFVKHSVFRNFNAFYPIKTTILHRISQTVRYQVVAPNIKYSKTFTCRSTFTQLQNADQQGLQKNTNESDTMTFATHVLAYS